MVVFQLELVFLLVNKKEEGHGRNADLILKHFISEGITCGHLILISSAEVAPEKIKKDLPRSINEENIKQPENDDDLKIAWRYKQNPIIDSTPNHISFSFGHTFDISVKLSVNEIENVKCWPEKDDQLYSYSKLYNYIQHIIECGFSIKIPVEQRNILKITISDLCSPLWDSTEMDVIQFLYKLRILLRSSYATCLITTKLQIIDAITKSRMEHLTDTVIKLKSMELSSCADYNGKLIIEKLASFNTFLYEPSSVDWATKLTRKKLCIEKLHLPPCIENNENHEKAEKTQLPSCSLGSSINF
ncbi:elongator complex protein 4 isoform X2 [Daktulosphaira vitifoliae]|uniref:elongator complex protein 4 isoform X2 n=1 Tax=Daktulosphaira vitifoliae TaxID=58002 RepID=UPI0021A9C401|nr:elongator complex protein 4 isoform X2 [Daktulosphaira vitifoliae]